MRRGAWSFFVEFFEYTVHPDPHPRWLQGRSQGTSKSRMGQRSHSSSTLEQNKHESREIQTGRKERNTGPRAQIFSFFPCAGADAQLRKRIALSEVWMLA